MRALRGDGGKQNEIAEVSKLLQRGLRKNIWAKCRQQIHKMLEDFKDLKFIADVWSGGKRHQLTKMTFGCSDYFVLWVASRHLRSATSLLNYLARFLEMVLSTGNLDVSTWRPNCFLLLTSLRTCLSFISVANPILPFVTVQPSCLVVGPVRDVVATAIFSWRVPIWLK